MVAHAFYCVMTDIFDVIEKQQGFVTNEWRKAQLAPNWDRNINARGRDLLSELIDKTFYVRLSTHQYETGDVSLDGVSEDSRYAGWYDWRYTRAP